MASNLSLIKCTHTCCTVYSSIFRCPKCWLIAVNTLNTYNYSDASWYYGCKFMCCILYYSLIITPRGSSRKFHHLDAHCTDFSKPHEQQSQDLFLMSNSNNPWVNAQYFNSSVIPLHNFTGYWLSFTYHISTCDQVVSSSDWTPCLLSDAFVMSVILQRRLNVFLVE